MADKRTKAGTLHVVYSQSDGRSAANVHEVFTDIEKARSFAQSHNAELGKGLNHATKAFIQSGTRADLAATASFGHAFKSAPPVEAPKATAKPRLFATSPDLRNATKAVEQFYGGQKMRLEQSGAVWNVVRESDGKVLTDVQVTRKGGRYRFEQAPPPVAPPAAPAPANKALEKQRARMARMGVDLGTPDGGTSARALKSALDSFEAERRLQSLSGAQINAILHDGGLPHSGTRAQKEARIAKHLSDEAGRKLIDQYVSQPADAVARAKEAKALRAAAPPAPREPSWSTATRVVRGDNEPMRRAVAAANAAKGKPNRDLWKTAGEKGIPSAVKSLSKMSDADVIATAKHFAPGFKGGKTVTRDAAVKALSTEMTASFKENLQFVEAEPVKAKSQQKPALTPLQVANEKIAAGKRLSAKDHAAVIASERELSAKYTPRTEGALHQMDVAAVRSAKPAPEAKAKPSRTAKATGKLGLALAVGSTAFGLYAAMRGSPATAAPAAPDPMKTRTDPYTTADGRQYRNGRLIVRSSH